MTTATKPLAPHGTLSRAKYHHCKCDTCRAASAAYQRTRHRKRGYGTWQPFVDAEPIRAHLALLREHGISYIRAAELAGLYTPTVGRLLYTAGGRPPVKRVRQETADALLAVQPGDIDPFTTDATGTIRRIQALAAIGWPLRALGAQLNVNPSTPGRLLAQTTLRTTTANTVRAAYDRLKGDRPEDHGVCPGSAVRARNWAQSQGWRDPTWWEDYGHLDDPEFDPAIDPAAKIPAKQITAEEARWLMNLNGLNITQAAERLGRSVAYVRTCLDEHPDTTETAA